MSSLSTNLPNPKGKSRIPKGISLQLNNPALVNAKSCKSTAEKTTKSLIPITSREQGLTSSWVSVDDGSNQECSKYSSVKMSLKKAPSVNKTSLNCFEL